MSFNYSTIYKELKRGDTGKMDANGRAGYSCLLYTSQLPAPGCCTGRQTVCHRRAGHPQSGPALSAGHLPERPAGGLFPEDVYKRQEAGRTVLLSGSENGGTTKTMVMGSGTTGAGELYLVQKDTNCLLYTSLET